MTDVPASEYINSLLAFYQTAEKIVRQAEADVVFAKKRREEARNIKDEAVARLEEAQKKYDIGNFTLPDRSPSLNEVSKRLVKRTVHHQGRRKSSSGGSREKSSHSGDGYKSDDPSASVGYSTLQQDRRLAKGTKLPNMNSNADDLSTPVASPLMQDSNSKHRSRPSKVPKPQKLVSPSGRRSTSIDGYQSDDPSASVRHAPLQQDRRSAKGSKLPNMNSNADDLSTPVSSPLMQDSNSKHRSRPSKVPKPQKLVSPSGRRSTSVGAAISKRSLMIPARDLVSPVLDICKGRSREWYEENLDCESLGLVKRFYQAALGTKTHAATNQIYISSVLLNDEWNDLATNTSEVQELYIGVSSNSDGKETLRDRAARALVQPPQKEPLAIFFAPKNELGTDDVYYGGHWKVVAGNMFEPPRVMKGTPRQCLVKLVFSGVDPEIVKAVNAD
jgi:hypothetical protein